MQYIVTDGKSGLKKSNPVKIFKNIVDTYNNNREEYNKILEEAREMINSDSTFKNNYFTWLSQKVSRERLSEIYIEYEYIEGLLLKRRLITDKLFSTRNPDIIYSAIKVLENDTNLKRYYKFNDYFKDLSYYYDYLISGEYNSNPTPVCSNSYKASAEKKETVQVEKTQENNTAENNSRLQLSRGQHFLDWLLFKKSYNTEKALDIVGFMISAEDFANNNNLPYQDILDVQAFEAEQTIGILSKNKEFRSLFKQSKRMTNFTIFSQYLNYVRINNITIPTSQHLNSIKNPCLHSVGLFFKKSLVY